MAALEEEWKKRSEVKGEGGEGGRKWEEGEREGRDVVVKRMNRR